ncbi:hypothetical protein QBC44DRAFT_333025 [Cladorrhinum sp. PSN332]|nr:hypothetical protein QBC44DRAFT_333025 [Cladorrhinum sp. PSN332]
MRISSRIDGSICGAILFWHRPASSTSWSAAIASLSSSSRVIARRRALSTAPVLRLSFTKPFTKPQTNPVPAGETKPAQAPSDQQLSTEEVLALVDPYDGEEIGSVEDYLQTTRDPYMRGYDEPKDPTISVTLTKDHVDYPSDEEVIKAGEEEQRTLWELRFAVMRYLKVPTFSDADLDHIFEIYQRLPEPRMLYLTARQRHLMLHALGQPGRVKYRSMLRYFSVIGDVKDSGIPLTQAEWNCTIHFAAKYVHTVSETENEAALKLWREMEVEAGMKADELTFNILFDTASKAGNFTLAEMIYREMEHRGFRYNRYHYVALIFFFGLRLETNGMRAAYRDMVLAGEIVDTVVLNAMISGLLRSNEDWAAIKIYERMKQGNPDLPELPVRTQLSDRAVNQVLQMFAKLGRKFPEGRPAFQKSALITPDFRTYDLLIKHFGVIQGDLDNVARLITDMKAFEIPVHGSIFLSLFKSFARHGGPYSAWTEQRLQTIWQAFLGALDGNAAGLEIHLWMALWVLRAFAGCYSPKGNEGPNEKLYEVHHQLKIRWDLNSDDEQAVIDHLAKIVRGRTLNIGNDPWI